MSDQRTFAGLAWSGKGKVTRREKFLAEMDAVIPRTRLIKLIEPHYPKQGRGRQPLGLETDIEQNRVDFGLRRTSPKTPFHPPPFVPWYENGVWWYEDGTRFARYEVEPNRSDIEKVK